MMSLFEAFVKYFQNIAISVVSAVFKVSFQFYACCSNSFIAVGYTCHFCWQTGINHSKRNLSVEYNQNVESKQHAKALSSLSYYHHSNGIEWINRI